MWEDVWTSIHKNILCSNHTKTIIWQQIHLNFYTQYSYNKWHQKQDPCPLCHKIPDNIYHSIVDCKIVEQIWNELEITLYKIHPIPVTKEEKALGIVHKKTSTAILLRNWLTYLLRQIISQAEREAYYDSSCDNAHRIRRNFRKQVESEIRMKAYYYRNKNREDFYDKIITHNAVLCEKDQNGIYHFRQLFYH